MKVFICADIEGVTGVTTWDETTKGNEGYNAAARQMTEEVIAACQGATMGGATEIYVRDAHGDADNIDMDKLPEGVKCFRGWMNSEDTMIAGVDSSFDAIIYIGFHSPAGSKESPLAHTVCHDSISLFKINGEIASEFTFNVYNGEGYGVPSVFISGDLGICNSAKELIGDIEVVPVKKCVGESTLNISYKEAADRIREGVCKSLKKINICHATMPDSFNMEISYKDIGSARRAKLFPGAELIDDFTVKYIAKDIKAMLIAKMFMI